MEIDALTTPTQQPTIDGTPCADLVVHGAGELDGVYTARPSLYEGKHFWVNHETAVFENSCVRYRASF